MSLSERASAQKALDPLKYVCVCVCGYAYEYGQLRRSEASDVPSAGVMADNQA